MQTTVLTCLADITVTMLNVLACLHLLTSTESRGSLLKIRRVHSVLLRFF